MFDFLLILFFFVFLIPKWAYDAAGKRLEKDKYQDMLNRANKWEFTVTNREVEWWATEVSRNEDKFLEYRDEVLEALRDLPYTEHEIFRKDRVAGKEHIRKIILMGIKGYLPRDIATNGAATSYFSYGKFYASEEEQALRSYPTVKWLIRRVNERHSLSADIYVRSNRGGSYELLNVSTARIPGIYYWEPVLEYNARHWP